MGALLTKFQKKKTTAEVLESLQERIDELEKFTFSTEEKKKRVVGTFFAVTVGIYILAFAAFYFVYFPPTWKERIFYSTPLILFPSVIMILRRLCTLYFQRKLNKNSNKLAALKAEKKKILEQVMDKETYKVAIKILARFGDKITPPNTRYDTTIKATSSVQNNAPACPKTPIMLNAAPPLSTTPWSANKNINSPMYMQSKKPPSTPLTSTNTMIATPNQQLRQRTPFPVVNSKEQSVFERIVDALIGDGPQNRYAMICKKCFGHNGMALKEDFEYATFRCIYCSTLNPARKLRPIAPRLSSVCQNVAQSSPRTSESSNDDSSDSGENVTVYQGKSSSHTDTATTLKSSSSCDNIVGDNEQDNSDKDNVEGVAENGSGGDSSDAMCVNKDIDSVNGESATLLSTSSVEEVKTK